ncbi:MAG: glycosyl hydrolase family 18 protein [Clostridia bacterium]
MKKKIICVTIMLILVLTTILTGCNSANFEPKNAENLAKGATYTNGKSVSERFSFSSKGRGSVNIKFDAPITFNTILLNETTQTVVAFEFWTKINGEDTLIYKQDEIGGMRYCYVDRITTDNLVLKVTSAGKCKLSKFEVYNIKRDMGDFRRTTYLSAGQFLSENLDGEGLKHVSDIILFGTAHYTTSGDIIVDEKTIEDSIARIKQIREGAPVNIFATFIMAGGQTAVDGVQPQELALKNNKDKLIANICGVVEKFALDGASFDYEYPYTLAEYDVYSNFLIALKQKLGSKKLSVAIAPWGLHFSKKVYDVVDYFEVMAYDLIDKRGNHCGWQFSFIKSLNYLESKGVPKGKIDMGVAFYSRPIDYGEDWRGYSGEVDKLGEFGNYVAEEFYSTDFSGNKFLVKGRWYNGVNMIQDKTAFAFDSGVGGMMMWHYNCDVKYSDERSLLRAMNGIFN